MRPRIEARACLYECLFVLLCALLVVVLPCAALGVVLAAVGLW